MEMSEEKTLSPVQVHVMDLLHKLIELFEEENISYYILGGTMLGAVRHKGFIPWDDDVDIGIERRDYERFLKTCSSKLPDYLKIRTYRDKSYHHYYYARIVDTRYHIKRMGSIKERQEELWIDLFPLDGMPDGKIRTLIHKARLLTVRLMYHMSCFDKVNVKRPGRPLVDRMIIKFLMITHLGKSWNSKKLLDKIDKLLKKYPVEDSNYVFNFMGSTHAFREIFSKKCFGKNTKYQFEDMMLVGPKEYDEYLSKLYGDYMKLPPESERNVHAEEFVEKV
jgi:lipopolysaccharide cholinephosphotransferase